MPTLIKTGNADKEQYFDFAALMIVLFTAELNGWRHSGGDFEKPFDQETSDDLCETLEQARLALEDEISSAPDDCEDICNDCFFKRLQKEHQVELIDDFLGFCESQPFRIDFEN